MSVNKILEQEKIWIAGHNGIVGSAIKRQLELQERSVVTVDLSSLNLRNQPHVEYWLMTTEPASPPNCHSIPNLRSRNSVVEH